MQGCATRRRCLLPCIHSWSPGLAHYPQDLLGDEEKKLHGLREGKTLAQGHPPGGRGSRVNFLTPSRQSSSQWMKAFGTGRQPENAVRRASSTSSLPTHCHSLELLAEAQPPLTDAEQRPLEGTAVEAGCCGCLRRCLVQRDTACHS